MELTPESWEKLRTEIMGQTDPTCSIGANLDHFLNIMQGYRDTIVDPETDEGHNPFYSGGAGGQSWLLGHRWAKADLALRSFNPCSTSNNTLSIPSTPP